MTSPSRSLSLLSLCLAAALALSQPVVAEPIEVSLVLTNDIDRLEEENGRGGFAKLAAVVAAERAKGNVIFAHAGDTISPSLLSGIDKGAHIIDILNKMELDVMVPGNHEFDFGPEVFQQRMSEATFPIVASNVSMPGGGGPDNTTIDKIFEIDGVKIGFYGLTTENTAITSSPGDIAILDVVDSGIFAANGLREQGADIIVALTHMHMSDDFALLNADAADIVLTGHEENLVVFFNRKQVITESGAQGEYVVITDLTIERTEKDGNASVSWEPAFSIIDTRDVEPDPQIAALVKQYTEEFDIEIGTTETAFDSHRPTVRGREAAIGNLIADAMREATGADVAITNGGGIRGNRDYPAGSKLTRKDVLTELPFGNRTVTIAMTGANLVKVLEYGFARAGTLSGGFPQISGMAVTVDIDKPVGHRVTSITIDGESLDPAEEYVLATNDFLARGGDGYDALTEGEQLIRTTDAILMATQVIDYIAANGTVAPKIEGRIAME